MYALIYNHIQLAAVWNMFFLLKHHDTKNAIKHKSQLKKILWIAFRQ